MGKKMFRGTKHWNTQMPNFQPQNTSRAIEGVKLLLISQLSLHKLHEDLIYLKNFVLFLGIKIVQALHCVGEYIC